MSKDADRTVNAVDPGQTAEKESGSSLFAQIYLFENLGLFW